MAAVLSARHEQRRSGGDSPFDAVTLPLDGVSLNGQLAIPEHATGLVLFAHGSGSSRHSPRTQFVARVLRQQRNATLLFDLLTEKEEAEDAITRHLRFDINLLAQRLAAATRWVSLMPVTKRLRLGYFGSSTGAAAALLAAASLGKAIDAVVSRGGRPDLAMDALPRVTAATLFIVGGRDELVLELNRRAYSQLACKKHVSIVPGATHLFEEPGTLESVAELAAGWFQQNWQRTKTP